MIHRTTSITYLPRLLLTTLEPLCAFFGVILLLTSPSIYLANLSRLHPGDLHPAALGASWIYTQLAGGWLLIIFLEAILLRTVDDIKVWRLVCAGILLSDALYTHSLAEAVGGWGEWVVVSKWTAMDWTAAVTTWPFVLTRVGIVLGLIGGEQVKRI